MLADAATVAGGKLYVQRGGWTQIQTPQIPAAHPALALVLIFTLESHEANEDIKFVIDLVDEDGQPVGLRGEALMRVAPGAFAKKGSELYQPTAQMLYGLRFEKYGTYRFRIIRNDAILASVPLTITPPPMTAAA